MLAVPRLRSRRTAATRKELSGAVAVSPPEPPAAPEGPGSPLPPVPDGGGGGGGGGGGSGLGTLFTWITSPLPAKRRQLIARVPSPQASAGSPALRPAVESVVVVPT